MDRSQTGASAPETVPTGQTSPAIPPIPRKQRLGRAELDDLQERFLSLREMCVSNRHRFAQTRTWARATRQTARQMRAESSDGRLRREALARASD